MHRMPRGWATDLAILEMTGSSIDDRGDHVVVRTRGNPDYHWGNCLLVTDPASVDDAHRQTPRLMRHSDPRAKQARVSWGNAAG